MKALSVTVLIAALSLCGCGKQAEVLDEKSQPGNAEIVLAARGSDGGGQKENASKNGPVEIKEKMFIAQVNDVYLNPGEYFGRIIKLEGLFKREQYGGKDYCFVLRYGPGCCGSDGNAGFEIAWESASAGEYPAADEWIGVTGELKNYQEDGASYLYIALQDLKVLKKRGAEYVTQ